MLRIKPTGRLSLRRPLCQLRVDRAIRLAMVFGLLQLVLAMSPTNQNGLHTCMHRAAYKIKQAYVGLHKCRYGSRTNV